MNKMRINILGTFVFFFMSIPTIVNAEDGAQLYLTKACVGCHGPEGRSVLPMYPKIAGQNSGYIYNQMRDIKKGIRSNGQSAAMKGIMAGVNEEQMRTLAEWLSTR